MLATIHIPCSAGEALLLQQSIELELADGPSGTSAVLELDDGLKIKVTGEDMSGFRAALNQVMRLIDTVERL